jgi:hypothetical protein
MRKLKLEYAERTPDRLNQGKTLGMDSDSVVWGSGRKGVSMYFTS